tara:strand:- start:8445 stop:9383 length:939 start_codon:yes stop_codon:yes gene_type:complete
MFEGCLFKYSKANWNDVILLNIDIDSTEDEIKKGKEVCEKLGIHWVNKDGEIFTSAQQGLLAADRYLTENGIDVDWLVNFEHDSVPLRESHWEDVDEFINNHPEINEKVGMFGANTHQGGYSLAVEQVKSDDLIYKRKNKTKTGRGNLIKGILHSPHDGWYKNLSDDYYLTDYFVSETVVHHMCAFNRKALKNLEADVLFEYDLWEDDIGHQMMLNGYLNIVIPDIIVSHDHGMKTGIELTIREDFKRNQKSHDRFIEKYGWDWGYRNLILREQFKMSRSFWSGKDIYENTIQEKLFEMDINDGPKRIEDFE